MEKGEITITVDKEELALIMAAMAYYRVAGFPLGRSSYSNPISQRDRREFAAFGMKVWDKLYTIDKGRTVNSG